MEEFEATDDLSREEILLCQFSNWYQSFSELNEPYRGRTNVTIKARILPLPESFLRFLDADGLILPSSARTSCAILEQEKFKQDEIEKEPSDLDELVEQIDEAIKDLGGRACPKLNWSAPKDATWINAGTLECRYAGDVFLLLKSSDFCNFDLHHALANPVPELALRKWSNLYPSQEFRCFVLDERINICQRNLEFFPHLAPTKDHVMDLIVDFFESVVQENVTMNRFVFDVYVDKKDRVWLIDLNVWGNRTDPLLYTWKELNENDLEDEIRLVEPNRKVQAHPLSTFRAPIDTLPMATTANGGLDFRDLIALCERSSSSDDEDDENR